MTHQCHVGAVTGKHQDQRQMSTSFIANHHHQQHQRVGFYEIDASKKERMRKRHYRQIKPPKVGSWILSRESKSRENRAMPTKRVPRHNDVIASYDQSGSHHVFLPMSS
jgi:hypothetical protein